MFAAGFIAAIRAEPDDDLLRLIYADYLDDNGDPLGRFIRTQIQLLHHPGDGPGLDELKSIESELLEEKEAKWLGPWIDEPVRWWFHRGLLELSMDIRRFLNVDQSWLDLPMIAGIHLHPMNYMDVDTVIELARSPRARRVRSLYLGFEWVRDVGARAIAESEHFVRLAALDLDTNGLTFEGAIRLATQARQPRLRSLGLRNNMIGDSGAASLAGSQLLSQLRDLDLSKNDISSVGAAALAAAPFAARLVHLKLHGNQFDGRSRGGRALRRRYDTAVSWR